MVMWALGLTETELAGQLGCSRAAVQVWRRKGELPKNAALRENFEILAAEAVRRIVGGEPNAL